ncbi:MAG: hypothetical protein JWO36_1506 [Myxococcales bacterium]|nr:hypothetical protein [Myxococcales bacterium]
MNGVTLRGNARPVAMSALAEQVSAWPRLYIELMAHWGPGVLCGVFELPDPTSPEFGVLQNKLRVQGVALRGSGHWATLGDRELGGGVVLGVDRHGLAAVALTPDNVVLLHPRGHVLPIGTFDRLIPFVLDRGLTHSFLVDYKLSSLLVDDETDALDLGAPALYIAQPGLARRAFLDALAARDEAAADSNFAELLTTEVALYALLELLELLGGPRGASVTPELRATYAEQCYRMAKRRAPALLVDVPIREIKRVLAGGSELSPELVKSLTVLQPPAGIFVGEIDPREAALLDSLVAEPDDPATRLVYADHLEERGDVARADAVRAEILHGPLTDAEKRGFLASPNRPTLDSAAQLRDHAARWHAEDPATSIDPLLDRIHKLHPIARHGYALLRSQLSPWGGDTEVDGHLAREIADAWPQIVLGLRGAAYARALQLLIDGAVHEAAPFLMSLLRHPSPGDEPATHRSIADAYVHLADVGADLVEEWLPYLAGDAPVLPIHAPRDSALGPTLLREVAFCLLQNAGGDERVFTAFIEHFCAAHPYSEHALKKRRDDPRVIAMLREVLAREEKRSLRDGKHVTYSPCYGHSARFLARLGDEHGKQAADRYKRFARWGQSRDRDRDM